jgi:mannitol/fructose-specific phosphotransferase system IIA component (Ntr-type)
MKLTDILKREFIKVPLAGATKEECIANLIDILAASKLVTNRAKVLDEVLAREEIMTTGVGNGIAIPTAKTTQPRNLPLPLASPKIASILMPSMTIPSILFSC